MNIENYIRERFKKEGGKLTTTGNMGQNIFCFSFCVFAHFSKFSMYAWGKKGKMLVFTGVYVCVKAKLTLVSFFSLFFLHLSLSYISAMYIEVGELITKYVAVVIFKGF